jgi:hypothetical protein
MSSPIPGSINIEDMAIAFAAIERHNLGAAPMQMSLGSLRDLVLLPSVPTPSEEVSTFLVATADVSPEAIVSLHEGHAKLLTSDAGNLLAFA